MTYTGQVSATALAKVRARVEGFMASAVQIVRVSGLGAVDATTGRQGPGSQSTVYTGPAHVRTRGANGTVAAGQGQVAVSQLGVTVPVAATGIHVDDVVLVTGCPSDTTLVGTAWRVLGANGSGALNDANQLSCEQVQASRYWSGA